MSPYKLALKKLKSDKRSFDELERLTDIPAETIRDIARGHTKSPRLNTLEEILRLYERETA